MLFISLSASAVINSPKRVVVYRNNQYTTKPGLYCIEYKALNRIGDKIYFYPSGIFDANGKAYNPRVLTITSFKRSGNKCQTTATMGKYVYQISGEIGKSYLIIKCGTDKLILYL